MNQDPCWMTRLHGHYRRMRRLHPRENLLVVFDIDGTLLDKRPMIHHLLCRYDREHGTDFFRGLSVADITVHEHRLERLLEPRPIPEDRREDILDFYVSRYWSRPILEKFHRPYPGALDVVSWFQDRERTAVALNTARPERLRSITLQTLNDRSRQRNVEFLSRLLYMQRPHDDVDAPGNKVRGLRTFQSQGYRVVAMVDNEPENLLALHEAGLTGEDVLLLHADTEYVSSRSHLPEGSVSGKPFDPAPLRSGAGPVPA